MNRLAFIALALVSFITASAVTARADFTFDLRAVSGSQITIHNPKSVAVNHNSVGGWIDFELWGVVNAVNATPYDDWVENFAGSMLSDQFGNGAIAGSMVNTGELPSGVRRGVAETFARAGYLDGQLKNLDSDPDLEIGGRTPSLDVGGLIAGRTGARISYFGNAALAEFLLYSFTIPVAGINAQGLSDITGVWFLPDFVPISFIWAEDGVRKNPHPLSPSRGTLRVAPAVLIHTADTPEELALIPEPGTLALALAGFATIWFAKHRRD